MNTTSSHLPICVHCGTPRPADETLCPTCGKPWIDTTIREPAGRTTVPVPPGVPPAVSTSPDDAEPDEDTEGHRTGSAGIAAAAAAGAVAAAAHRGPGDKDTEATDDATEQADAERNDPQTTGAGVAGVGAAASTADGSDSTAEQTNTTNRPPSDSDTDIPAVAPPPPAFGRDDTGEFEFGAWTEPIEEEGRRRTAWLVPAGIGAAILAVLAFIVFGGNSTTTTTVAAIDTTTASVSTTTTTPTTTTAPTTTTTPTVAIPQPGDWPATGTPIDIADLTLTASAIGQIDIGMPIGDVAGMLTASLGEATEASVDGLCPPEESYRLSFGQLTAIFDGFDAAATFVSYRYDAPEGSDTDLGLKTLSGIGLGDTVEDLINTYTQFTISFEVIESKDYFRLTDGGDLLLWGPLSSADLAGLIEGIYSPSACDPSP